MEIFRLSGHLVGSCAVSGIAHPFHRRRGHRRTPREEIRPDDAPGIYAALLAAGGIMGFVKARSRPSLIAGLVSALAALVALWFSLLRSPLGFPLGMALSAVLFVFFGYRYALRNRKFMPNGMMAVV